MKHNIIEDDLIKEKLIVNESIFSIGNGYIGIRGNFEEGYLENLPTIRGTYINAFYDIVSLSYSEKAYGFPETMQKLLNNIDAQTLIIELEDGETVSPITGRALEYKRILDLDHGYVQRSFIYETKNSKKLRVSYKKLVSLTKRELFLINLELEPISYFGEVRVKSTINGDVYNYTDEGDPRVATGHAKLLNVIKAEADESLSVVVKTSKSDLICACNSVLKSSLSENEFKTDKYVYKKQVEEIHRFSLDKKVDFTKYTIYTDTLRHNEPFENGKSLLKRCEDISFSEWVNQQTEYLTLFWETANINIIGEKALQEGLSFNMFQLLQSVGKDKWSNIAAKGLTGEGYEGHYFWDTEIFIFPVFLLTNPELAKNLLLYRYEILEQAKRRAIEMGHSQGALYPWRTISGTECSSYFPAGTAQYHISGDIAYAFVSYYLTTNDLEFMALYGAEMLFETARLWIDVGHEKNGRFFIDCVTGPDEYTAIVNNNYYTNAIAKYNLYWANKIYKDLSASQYKELLVNLFDKIHLSVEEIVKFKEISEKMYLPYNNEMDINPQDDSFLNKKIWDFEGTPKDKYPLLIHFHPLTIYRYQVLKQADTVLSHFLLEDYVGVNTIRNSYNYYEKLTTHDSSLSCCISSIMACKLGYEQKAYDYFMETARLDLDNTHNNTKDGLHMANMGGTFMGIVYGFAGLRIKEDGISFSPMICRQWEGYQFNIQYRGRILCFKMNLIQIEIEVQGAPLDIKVYNRMYHVTGMLLLDCK